MSWNSQHKDKLFFWTWIFLISLHQNQRGYCLQCHECHDLIVLKKSPHYRADCKFNAGPLKDGYAGCIEIWGFTDGGQVLIIRTGHTNKQVEGRVPSCYHAEQSFVVDAVVENMKFDTISTCYVCDHRDGCNGGTNLNLNYAQQLKLFLFSSVAISLFYAHFH